MFFIIRKLAYATYYKIQNELHTNHMIQMHAKLQIMELMKYSLFAHDQRIICDNNELTEYSKRVNNNACTNF